MAPHQHTISYSHGSVEVAGTEYHDWYGQRRCHYTMLFSAWCSCRHFRYHGTRQGRRAAVREHKQLAQRWVPRLTERQWTLLDAVDDDSPIQAWNAYLAIPYHARLTRWDWADLTPVYVIGRGLRWTIATLIADCHGPCCPTPVPVDERGHVEYVWGTKRGGFCRFTAPVAQLEPHEMVVHPNGEPARPGGHGCPPS